MATINIKDINTEFQVFPIGLSAELTVNGMIDHLLAGGSLPPIIISRCGYLQDGRHRLEAYRRLGIDQIPVEYEHNIK